MQVTNVNVKKIDNGSRLKGVATITLDNEFVIHNLKIVEKKDTKELFISMPSRKNKEGQFKDYCHPITKELRENFTKSILEKFIENK